MPFELKPVQDPILIFTLLMAILLVIGVMDLRAMTIVAIAITLERLAPAANHVARATGALTICAGMFLIARAVGLA